MHKDLELRETCYWNTSAEPTKTLVLHCDSVASRGMAQRLEMAVVTTSHGREEVGNETCFD